MINCFGCNSTFDNAHFGTVFCIECIREEIKGSARIVEYLNSPNCKVFCSVICRDFHSLESHKSIDVI